MNPSPEPVPTVGIRILKTLLVLILSTGGVFLAGRLFPLPKGMGLQYVAHPFWALVGAGLATVGYGVVAFVASRLESEAFWIALACSIGFSFLIFLSP